MCITCIKEVELIVGSIKGCLQTIYSANGTPETLLFATGAFENLYDMTMAESFLNLIVLGKLPFYREEYGDQQPIAYPPRWLCPCEAPGALLCLGFEPQKICRPQAQNEKWVNSTNWQAMDDWKHCLADGAEFEDHDDELREDSIEPQEGSELNEAYYESHC